MTNKFIKKTKLNVHSMIRHGSVAVITLFSVGILFGMENVMLAFPIALTSTVMGRQNFHVKTMSKALRIILLDLTIVIAAHISSLNLLLAIPINFTAIFLIMYTIVSPYDLTFYKPFLMLFIFTQYTAVPTSQLYLRVMAVILGIGIVILASIIKKVNEKSVLGNSVMVSLGYINEQLEKILNNAYDDELQDKGSKAMRDLAYKIYITRHRDYLTTNLGKIQFGLFISIEYFNISLRLLKDKFDNGGVNRCDIDKIKEIIEDIIKYEKNEIQLESIKSKLRIYITLEGQRLSNILCEMDSRKKEKHFEKENFDMNVDLIGALSVILNCIEELESLGNREINKIYDQWERTDIDRPRVAFKEYLDKDSIRLKFAMRMSLTMTAALFLGETLGYYKVIWAIITMMSIMQPYYEDTIARTKERVIGNILAIVVTGVIINIADSKLVTIIILVASLYLLYGFKEYYKMSLFAGIASICISSLTYNINQLIIYRIVYVVIGVIAVILVNKYVFPYRLKDGIDALVRKILRLKKQLIKDVQDSENKKFKEHDIRDIVIHSTLLSQKLYLRNLQYGDESIEEFICENNKFVIFLAYDSLKI